MQIPSAVELETGPEPDSSVIWLHGLGADGHDFEPIVPELRLPASMHVRFVFPHAPERPVTINGGMRMRAWYDILTLDRDGPQDEAGVLESARLLELLIEREHQRGTDYARIIVAGFSQGGAIALYTALRFGQPLAGVMALSTYLPLSQSVATEIAARAAARAAAGAAALQLPIFMAHGTLDPMLPIDLGKSSRRVLDQAGYPVEWHEYAMAHSVCAEEIADIRRWLITVLGAAG